MNRRDSYEPLVAHTRPHNHARGNVGKAELSTDGVGEKVADRRGTGHRDTGQHHCDSKTGNPDGSTTSNVIDAIGKQQAWRATRPRGIVVVGLMWPRDDWMVATGA